LRGPSAEPLETFGSSGGEAGGNAANPRVGSRVQQTCSGRAEKTVEVVRDHEGGTSEAGGTCLARVHGEESERRCRFADVESGAP
jgi:hypothetical protein